MFGHSDPAKRQKATEEHQGVRSSRYMEGIIGSLAWGMNAAGMNVCPFT